MNLDRKVWLLACAAAAALTLLPDAAFAQSGAQRGKPVKRTLIDLEQQAKDPRQGQVLPGDRPAVPPAPAEPAAQPATPEPAPTPPPPSAPPSKLEPRPEPLPVVTQPAPPPPVRPAPVETPPPAAPAPAAPMSNGHRGTRLLPPPSRTNGRTDAPAPAAAQPDPIMQPAAEPPPRPIEPPPPRAAVQPPAEPPPYNDTPPPPRAQPPAPTEPPAVRIEPPPPAPAPAPVETPAATTKPPVVPILPAAAPASVGVRSISVKVKSIEGPADQVEWRILGEDWKPMKVGDSIDARAEIRTGLGVGATFLLDGEVEVRVDRLSRLRVERLAPEGSQSVASVDLRRGQIEVRPVDVNALGVANWTVHISTPDQSFTTNVATQLEYDAFTGTHQKPLSAKSH